MIQVFGIKACKGCIQFLALLIEKGLKYEYYDVKSADGLALLASYGLADQEETPIIVENGHLVDFDMYVKKLTDTFNENDSFSRDN